MSVDLLFFFPKTLCQCISAAPAAAHVVSGDLTSVGTHLNRNRMYGSETFIHFFLFTYLQDPSNIDRHCAVKSTVLLRGNGPLISTMQAHRALAGSHRI